VGDTVRATAQPEAIVRLFIGLASYVFGCRHARYSFPQTVRGKTTVACLECGKELRYDWQNMRVIKSARQERAHLRFGDLPGAGA